jgi:hypothetical protein
LQESVDAGERVGIQFREGIINPMELAKLMGVRPQMVYQDIRSGKLTHVVDNNTQKKVVPAAIAIDYAAKYLDRKAQRILQHAQEAEAIAAAS